MRTVILAGGMGRRLIPYTVVLPKPLMPVGDYPILEIMIRQMKKRGLKDITLAVGYLGNLIEAFFGDGKRLGVKIRYKYEEKPLGTVGPLAQIPGLKSTFMVTNGDLFTLLDYAKVIAHHKKSKAIATIAAQRRSVPIDFGVIRSRDSNLVSGYVEKPRLSYQVSMGVYVFESEVLKFIPKGRKLDFPELIQTLVKKKKRVAIYPSSAFWLDIGRPDDYARAVDLFPKLKAKLF